MTRSAWLALVVAMMIAPVAAHADASADPPQPAVPACADDPQYDGGRGSGLRAHVRASRFLGLTPRALVATFGQPDCKSAGKWRYWLPRGCAYDKDVVTLTLTRDKVTRAAIVHVITGDECR